MIRVRFDFILDESEQGLSAMSAIGNLASWMDDVFDGNDTTLWTVESNIIACPESREGE